MPHGYLWLLAAIAAFATIGPSAAATRWDTDLRRIDQQYQKCLTDRGDNNGMKICTFDALKLADAVLNDAYRAVLQKLGDGTADGAERTNRLKVAERAWIVFRDAQCKLEAAEMLGGSGEALAEGGCLYQATVERVRKLTAVYLTE